MKRPIVENCGCCDRGCRCTGHNEKHPDRMEYCGFHLPCSDNVSRAPPRRGRFEVP